LSSSRKIVCETPLLKQVYNELKTTGKAGLSICELMAQLGLQYYDARTVMRNICRKGLAVSTLHDQGKSEIRRFVFMH